MAGRGGRGAQLLQALELPARKPQSVGQTPPSQAGQGQPPPGQQPYPGHPPHQGQQQQYGQPPSGQPPYQQQRPMGPGQQPYRQQQFGGRGMNPAPGQFQHPPQGSRLQQGQYPPRGQVPQGQQRPQMPMQQGQFPHRGPAPQRGPFPAQGGMHPQPRGQYPPPGQQGPPQQGQFDPRGPQPRGQFDPRGPQTRGQFDPRGPQPRGQFDPRGPQPRGQFDPRGPQPRGQFQPQGPPAGRGMPGQPREPHPMGRGAMPPMQQSIGRGGPPQQNFGQRPPPPSQGAGMQQQLRQPQSFGRGGPLPGAQRPPGPQQPFSGQQQPSSIPQQPSPIPQQPQQSLPRQPLQQQPPARQQQTGGPPTEALQQMSIQPKAPNTQTGERGTAGVPVPLAVNYIPIRCKTEGVFQYCVSYSPEVDSRGMRYRLLYDHSDYLGETRAFDGIQLYLPYKLEQQPTILKSTRPTDGAEVTLTVQMVKFVESDQSVQLYNIIFRKVMRSLQMQQVGRYYYDPTRPALIPQHKLELWPGYITSIQHYQGGLMLLADVSHRLLRTDNVLEFLQEMYVTQKNNFQDVATKALIGSVVLTRYNNKTYRIDDVEWDKNPTHMFTFHNGQQISYVDYYKKNYNIDLVSLNQPLLLHRPKQKQDTGRQGRKPPLEILMLVPELCSMTGLTDAMRSDFKVMKDLAVHTRVTPMQREECMRKFLANVNGCEEAKKHLSIWGLELDPGLLRTDGRLLPSEKIKFSSNSVMSNQQADWGRDAVKESVITPVALNSWLCVFTKRDQSKAFDFIQTMKKVTPAMGIGMADPIVLEARDDRTETYLRTIREHLNPNVQMVVIIFPSSRDDRYAAVKKLCCVECPVPSQVINARTISQQNKLRSVTQKIALQINCKLGGELWALDIPLKSLMVVGIDVYHDASRGGRSVGGFVASTNRSLTRWYSRVCFQTPGQELVDGLKMCLTSALKKFHEVNHTLPEKIIVFRDGVGDGQLNTVGSYEVPQLSECFALFGESYQPQMTMIVVQKRVNTRIFSCETRGSQHMLDNPGPGTVLDHTITRKDWYDFFLVSQHVRQGTVTPTHYIVVHNTSSLKPDHVQRLSYKLTHLYYNWPGTVRVPAPCQYAHKLAYLVGTSIHKDPALALSDRLFYL